MEVLVSLLRPFLMRAVKMMRNPGLVHAVSYSLLLLNTDLHVADLATRMSKSQFVRNTLSAIQSQLRIGQGSSSDLNYDDNNSLRGGGGSDGQETISSRNKRSGSVTSCNSVSRDTIMSTPGTSIPSGSASQVSTPGEQPSLNGSSSSVYESRQQNSSVTSIVYNRSWEMDMENLLKVFDIHIRRMFVSNVTKPGNVQRNQKPTNPTAFG